MLHLLLAGLLTAPSLSFTQAVDAVAESPRVQAAREVAERRGAHARNVSRLNFNPTVQVQPGARRFAGGGSGGEVYLGVAQRFNVSGLGTKRKESLDRELAHDASMVELTRRQLRREVAEAWLSRWTAQQLELIAKTEVELASELEQRIAATVSAGEGTRVDLAVARGWRAEAGLMVLSAEGDMFESGVALARALGVEADAPQAVSEDLPSIDLPEDATLRAHAADVKDLPAVTASRAEREAESARLTELSAARGPTFAVGALGWREGNGDLAAVATLEMELPVFERGERDRATAAAQVARAEGQEREAVVAMRAERTLLLHDVEHTREVMELVDRQKLTAAEELAEAQRKRLEAREATAQEWVLARRAVLEAKAAAVRAHAEHVLARFLAAESWDVSLGRNTR